LTTNFEGQHRRLNPILTPTVIYFDSVTSTNDEAARHATAGAQEGLCVVAREQTAGRGRHRRVWASPKDAGLYFSVVLRPSMETENWPLISLMSALAVHDALAESCALGTDIKWPNDILASGRKLSGILAETIDTPAGRAIVVGIGINLDDRAFPPEVRDSATSITSQTNRPPHRDEILQSLTRALASRYEELQLEGGKKTTLEWAARSSFAEGKCVRVDLAGEIFEGQTRGLEPDGALRVETADGQLRIVRAGDVTALRPVASDK
jgi:BirA family biotin operon repressor/biotin-[acetyl-CoA-carboxylase] ligase